MDKGFTPYHSRSCGEAFSDDDDNVFLSSSLSRQLDLSLQPWLFFCTLLTVVLQHVVMERIHQGSLQYGLCCWKLGLHHSSAGGALQGGSNLCCAGHSLHLLVPRGFKKPHSFVLLLSQPVSRSRWNQGFLHNFPLQSLVPLPWTYFIPSSFKGSLLAPANCTTIPVRSSNYGAFHCCPGCWLPTCSVWSGGEKKRICAGC